MATHEKLKYLRPSGAVMIACIILGVFWHGLATAKGPDEDFLKERAAKVIVRGVKPNVAASGFLWKRQDWVITNLHAIPSDIGIKVWCGGLIQPAQVIKVLPRADLALLQVDPPTDGRPALHRCKPFAEAHLVEPDLNDELIAYGWLGNAPDAGAAIMKKTGAGTLKSRIPRENNVMKELEDYGIPDMNDFAVYFVQGGSYPGYSGASVVDEQFRLVAIVDGGLNAGLETYNWAIPASALRTLEEEGVKWEPRHGEKPDWLWSAGFADPDEESVLEYREQDWYDEDKFYDYNWVRTKRLSLHQLAESSMDPAGILALLSIYGDAAGGDVNPTFDVYEDLNQRLIIAVPADQGLSMESMFDDHPQFKQLRSEAVPEDLGSISYLQTNEQVTSSSALNRQISPNDPAFLNEKVSELLAECTDFGEWSCEIDRPTLRVIRFANGSQILKVGIKKARVDKPFNDRYSYYSFAVRSGITFSAEASFDTPRGGAGLIQCAIDPGSAACADPRTATTQLSQMLAVHLTTIADDNPWSGRSLETTIAFDSSADDPCTIGVPYFEGNEVRFFNSRGKIWLENQTYGDGFSETMEYLEYDRKPNYVFLADWDRLRIKLPVNGGKYQRSDDGGRTWYRAGRIEGKVNWICREHR